jgi:hypothetical protein
LADFSQRDSLRTALSKTFDGRHPCALCLKVREGSQEENRQQQRAPWDKLERMPEVLWQLNRVSVPAAPTAANEQPFFAPQFYSDFTDSPPTPPPRASAQML